MTQHRTRVALSAWTWQRIISCRRLCRDFQAGENESGLSPHIRGTQVTGFVSCTRIRQMFVAASPPRIPRSCDRPALKPVSPDPGLSASSVSLACARQCCPATKQNSASPCPHHISTLPGDRRLSNRCLSESQLQTLATSRSCGLGICYELQIKFRSGKLEQLTYRWSALIVHISAHTGRPHLKTDTVYPTRKALRSPKSRFTCLPREACCVPSR